MPGSSAGHLMGIELEVGLIVVTVTITVTIVFHMVHGAAIAFFEAIPEYPAIALIDGRMFVDVVVVCIGVAMLHVVASSGFHAFVEALALHIAIAVGGAIPIAILIAVLILGCTGCRLCFMRDGLDGSGRCNAEGKSGN